MKKTITVMQNPALDKPGNVYVVTKTVNTVAVEIGERLSKEQVARLIMDHFTVNIVGVKA